MKLSTSLSTIVFILSSLVTGSALGDDNAVELHPFPAPGPVFQQQVTGEIKVTTIFCIQIVGVDCPPPRVEIKNDDGLTLLTGKLADDLRAFDNQLVTVKGVHYGLPVWDPDGAHEVLEVESFTAGEAKSDFATGTIKVANNRNFPPDVYLEMNDGRTVFIDNPYARQKLAAADGAEVTLNGRFTSPKHFRPTSNTFMVKGKIHSRPMPLCLPGGPCGPFPSHGVELPSGTVIDVDYTGKYPDNYVGRGETRWVELELNPARPRLLTGKSLSGEVWGRPAIDPWPPWVGPIVPFNGGRFADTTGGASVGAGRASSGTNAGGLRRD